MLIQKLQSLKLQCKYHFKRFFEKSNYKKLLPHLCCSFISSFIIFFIPLFPSLFIPIWIFEFYGSTILITRQGVELQPFPKINAVVKRVTYFQDSTSVNLTFRSSHQRCSTKNVALINFANFTGKDLCQGPFLNKVADLRSLF